MAARHLLAGSRDVTFVHHTRLRPRIRFASVCLVALILVPFTMMMSRWHLKDANNSACLINADGERYTASVSRIASHLMCSCKQGAPGLHQLAPH